jgi:hypothetical protein
VLTSADLFPLRLRSRADGDPASVTSESFCVEELGKVSEPGPRAAVCNVTRPEATRNGHTNGSGRIACTGCMAVGDCMVNPDCIVNGGCMAVGDCVVNPDCIVNGGCMAVGSCIADPDRKVVVFARNSLALRETSWRSGEVGVGTSGEFARTAKKRSSREIFRSRAV